MNIFTRIARWLGLSAGERNARQAKGKRHPAPMLDRASAAPTAAPPAPVG
ncbi:hypothetical protein ACFSUK_12035 [Sphingobium scionense]